MTTKHTTANSNSSQALIDSQLVWQAAQIACYRRADGQHFSYVVWLDRTLAEKPVQLMECKTGRIVALPDIETAKLRVAEAEAQAGRAEPVDEAVFEVL